MKEGFDVAVVGAGPAGISAAYLLASAGIKTVVFERGDYPGAKNMSGGVLYGQNLAEIIPDYPERHCPIERNIIESRVWYLSEEGGYSLGYRDTVFAGLRKYNAFTVGRSKFDRWYAEQAAGKGALVVAATAVEDLLRNDRGAVVGVVTGRKDGEVAARVTVLADGINSPLAARTGFRPETRPEDVALAVKEIIDLPAETIQQRFAVAEDQGVTTEVLGSVTMGMDGIGVLYTNQSSISLAIGARLADFVKHKVKPYELMEGFKQHPMLAALIAGGKPREYIAHWLPEAGYDGIPSLYGDGFVIAGDSAMLFNALHREGNNLAMTSGKLAAEAIIEAFKRGDLSRQGLSLYGEKLADSYVMKDMKKYRKFGTFLYRNRELFNQLPRAASFAAREILTVDRVSKKEKQKLICREMSRQGLSVFQTLRLLWRGWRAVK